MLKTTAHAIPLTYADQGAGPAFLVLHGGAGPQSVAGLAAGLAGTGRVVAPVIPGFNGTERPENCGTIGDLARAFLGLIDQLGLREVTVIGNSVGGWIAAEMGLAAHPSVARIVLINAVGIAAEAGHAPIQDPTRLAPPERMAAVFHDPARFAQPPSPEGLAMMAANTEALMVYAGAPFMFAPDLSARLATLSLPALILWGASDRIVDLDYARHYARAIPDARLEIIPEAGHFPQIEQPERVGSLIADFAG